MDAVDFQEKMDQNHREIFCRMLGVKELPERLLEQYLQVKMMTDRIDGFLDAGNLAIIAVMAGFGPNSKAVIEKARQMGITVGLEEIEQAGRPQVEQPVALTADEVADKVTEQMGEQLVDEKANKPRSIKEVMAERHSNINKVEEPTVGLSEANEQLVGVNPVMVNALNNPGYGSVPEKETAPKPDKKETFWSPGMPVKVLHEEEFKQGKIVGIISPGQDTDKAIQLTVKFEDSTTVTVDENEVEAE